VLFPSDPTARVEVWLGEHSLGRARLCLPRPDVLDATDIQLGATSGFDLTTDLSNWPGANGETTLKVVATSVTGERFELRPVPVTVAPKAIKLGSRISASARLPRTADRDGPSVLVWTHQLDLGGAQLYLLDLLSELLKGGAANPTVVSAIDGPVRARFEELGIPVRISEPAPVHDAKAYARRIEELTLWAGDRDFDAVLINTATTLALPGADVAVGLELPAIWVIHESLEPSLIWAYLDPEVRRRSEKALNHAAMVVFEAEATRCLYEAKISPGCSVTLPYGLELAPIDEKRADFNRAAARRAADIPKKAEVILCVGTVEPRKAQLPLAQAFDLIADRHPRARLVFVGGSDNLDSRLLSEYIDACNSADRIDLIPISPHVQQWYGIADLLVCASDIESLPRTVLEAMAWETPVLATSVFGLPELIDDGETGWLCEPRDVGALAAGLDRALSTSAKERGAIGGAARALVERRHSLDSYARDVARLLHEAIENPPGGIPGTRVADR
jgi:glycosyltransferase involved in cell wall biosynthesis